MEKGIFKFYNNNKENKAIYIVINNKSYFLHNNTKLNNLHKNISANFINIIMPKSMIFFFIIIEDKINNELRIYNISKFCSIHKYFYFQDINVHNYYFDFVRDIMYINKQKGLIINYNDINKNKLKLKKYINKFIYNCKYFNYRSEDKLILLKIKKVESSYIEKNSDEKKIIALIENKNEKRDDDTKDETNNDMKNSILDKKLLKRLPPKMPSLYDTKYKYENVKIPNIFYNHLLITNDAIKNKKGLAKCSLTRRIKGKSLNILYYSPVSKY